MVHVLSASVLCEHINPIGLQALIPRKYIVCVPVVTQKVPSIEFRQRSLLGIAVAELDGRKMLIHDRNTTYLAMYSLGSRSSLLYMKEPNVVINRNIR